MFQLSKCSVSSTSMFSAAARWAAPVGAMLLAAGCSVMQPNVRPAPQPPPEPVATPVPEPPAPPPVVQAPRPQPEPKVAEVPPPPSDAEPKIEPLPQGAPNLPYVINGELYVPEKSDVSMAQAGIASWYGKPFHGRKTANGEIYNMHRMTAAHKTMPLPSYALVRNTDNGKEVIVRVNDRGPFKKGRIIDLSYAAAQALDIQGLGKVEVVRLTHSMIREGSWRTPSVMALRKTGKKAGRAVAAASPVAGQRITVASSR